MHVKRIELREFRNYQRAEVAFSPTLNLLNGRNAQGKSNLLEAVGFLATGRSFRAAQTTDLIRQGAETLLVRGEIARADGEHAVAIACSASKRQVTIDGQRSPRLARVLGLLNVVVIAPADIAIVTGAPVVRRRVLDMQIAQVDQTYLATLQRYQETLRQKNALLKARHDEKTLDAFDDRLIEYGVRIAETRRAITRRIALLGRLYLRRITDGAEELAAEYRSEITGPDVTTMRSRFAARLHAARRRERAFGYALVGPHRDDVIFAVNGTDVRRFGSEGQRRSAVIALRMAELELIRSRIGEPPVVLIDDVTAELDPLRRRAFMPLLEGRGQVIVASADEGPLDLRGADAATGRAGRPRPAAAKRFWIENGAIKPLSSADM
ncbi:MAG: DNA replication/repair protein RecF [Verrucomicrobia bacterium]|nr:DNA replication/repair protein RecF [Verrucomicrobiota bacterium]